MTMNSLYWEMTGDLRIYAARLGRRNDADDVVQEAMLSFHKTRSRFDSRKPIKPYLFSIVRNKSIDANRRHNTHGGRFRHNAAASRKLQSRFTGPAESALCNERNSAVRAAVAKLPPVFRDAIEAVYFRGLMYHEAAAEQGVPLGTLKSRVHEAIARLRTGF